MITIYNFKKEGTPSAFLYFSFNLTAGRKRLILVSYGFLFEQSRSYP